MHFDPTKAPGSRVDSGDHTPTVAEDAPGSAPEEEVTAEAGPDEASADAAGEPAPAAADTDPAADDDARAPHHNIAALSAKADEYLGLAQRTKADFENYRKRAVREAAAAQ